LCWSLNHQNT
jgi:hypothetical protein